MQLIGDIINELVDTDKTLTSPLLKTKVLASRIKNVELSNWVNQELNGYEDAYSVPSYRSYISTITGSYMNGQMFVPDQPLPLSGIPDDIQKKMRQINFAHSVEALENLIKNTSGNVLEETFPAEITSVIERNIKRKGNPYVQIIKARRFVSPTVVSQTLSIIRSKLLDFSLKLEDEFGHITEFDQLKKNNDKILRIMNQTIISGNGNVVTSGDSNNVHATVTVQQGDKESLKKVLKDNHVSEEDIYDLISIIDTNPPNSEVKIFDSGVNSWIQKMFGKTLDGSWQVGIGAAGTLLADAIKAYYGV